MHAKLQICLFDQNRTKRYRSEKTKKKIDEHKISCQNIIPAVNPKINVPISRVIPEIERARVPPLLGMPVASAEAGIKRKTVS